MPGMLARLAAWASQYFHAHRPKALAVTDHTRRTERIEALTTAFDRDALAMVQSVASSSLNLQGMSDALLSHSNQTSTKAIEAEAAAAHTSTHVQAIATAAEQLAASVREIHHQVSSASLISHNASDEANTTTQEVSQLAEVVSKIGHIVEFIKSIAAQTKLLALNASIQAACAGENGRAFAVVADEVNALALQTSNATTEISRQIAALQERTAKVVIAIKSIQKAIEKIERTSALISDSTEEQSLATNDIAASVEQAATGASTVHNNIADIRISAELNGNSSKEVLGASIELAMQANKLRETTRKFLDDVLAVGAVLNRPASRPDELRFVAGNIPPYAFEKDGTPSGAAIQILYELSRRMNANFEIEFQPWARAQKTAQLNKSVGIVPLSRTKERENLYKWVGPIVGDSEVLMFSSNGKSPPTALTEARRWRVAVLRGSPGEAALQNAGFDNLVALTDIADCAKALNAKEIDAWSVAKLVAPYQFSLHGFDPKLLRAGPSVRQNDIYLGLSIDVPDYVVEKWQKSLDELKSKGVVNTILNSFS